MGSKGYMVEVSLCVSDKGGEGREEEREGRERGGRERGVLSMMRGYVCYVTEREWSMCVGGCVYKREVVRRGE